MTDHVFPIEDADDFRSWKRRYPNAEALLFRIVYRWRISTARPNNGQPGKWVANPIDFWAEDAKLSRDQTKRALRILDRDGLILRARSWYQGPKVQPFLQPTPLALKFMGKPNDIDRLEQSITASKVAKAAPSPTPIDAPTVAPTVAPTAAPTITNPSIPSKPSKPASPSNAQAHAHAKGKEGFGEDGKIKKTKLILKKQNPKTPIPPPPQTTDVDALIAIEKAKAKEALAKKRLPKLLAKFPMLTGAHEKFVRHPYQMQQLVCREEGQGLQAAVLRRRGLRTGLGLSRH